MKSPLTGCLRPQQNHQFFHGKYATLLSRLTENDKQQEGKRMVAINLSSSHIESVGSAREGEVGFVGARRRNFVPSNLVYTNAIKRQRRDEGQPCTPSHRVDTGNTVS